MTDNSAQIFFHEITSNSKELKELFTKDFNKNVYCLFICTNGNVKVQIEGGVYDLSDGDVCIYTPERNVRLLSVSNDIRGILVGGSNKFVHNAIYSIFSAERVLYIRTNPTFHLEKEQKERLFKLIEAGVGIFMEKNEKKNENLALGTADFHEKTIKALLEGVCFYVMDLYSRSRVFDSKLEQPKTGRSLILHKFLVSLYYNYIKERSVEFYANQQSLSKRYFSTTIKTESGKSPKQWIEEIVIEEIKHYLSNDSMTIKEIAFHFNFPSQSFFGKYFKQAVGVSPKDYRDSVIANKEKKS